MRTAVGERILAVWCFHPADRVSIRILVCEEKRGL